MKLFCEIFQGQVNAEFIASCLIERIWKYSRNTQVALTWFNEKYLEHFIMRFVNACFLLQQQKKPPTTTKKVEQNLNLCLSGKGHL